MGILKTIDSENNAKAGFYFENNDLINPEKFLYSSSKILNFSLSKITEIKKECFKNIKNIEQIKLPRHLRTVNQRAFENCQDLKSVFLGSLEDGSQYDNKRIVIRSDAFRSCYSLEFLFLKSKKIIVEKDAFYDCPNLKVVVLDSTNINLRDNAFSTDDLTLYMKSIKSNNLKTYCKDNNINYKEF